MFPILRHPRNARTKSLRLLCRSSLLLTLALTLPVPPVTANPLPDKPHIYVEGYAEIEVEPDLMVVTVSLLETNDELAVAKETVDERSRTLIQLARDIGIDGSDIATTSLGIRPAYEYLDDRRVDMGTSVYRQVTLTLRDLSRYPELMEALVAADISSLIETRLKVSNQGALTEEALARSLEDARQRAEELAASQDKRLGEVFSISEFASRADETYRLYPSRRIVGQSSRALGDVQAFSAPSREPFEPGLMMAVARVYVVYILR